MNNLLSIVLWLPLAGAALLIFFPRSAERPIKWFGMAVAVLTFLLSLLILPRFQSGDPSFQLVEAVPWIPQWGITYALGVDGISLWLVLLTTLLAPVVLLSSWHSIDRYPKEYVISMLALEFGMIGAFVALDLLLFYVFFELMLIPMYLIIGVWGGANRIYAAIKFFLFTIAGSLLMLLAILYLGFYHWHTTGTPSFAIGDFYGLSIPLGTQTLLFFAFAIAFAIKVPLFPLHTWLPDAHVEAPTGGSIILAGVLLKLGTYGFLRFVLPFFPEATAEWTWLFAALSVIGIIYGALVAWVQPDMKKLVAYSSVSHLGFVVLGIFAMTQASVEGSILQMINHGLSTGALFLLVGVIYDRRHTRLLADYGGLAKSMPVYTVVFVISVLASVGLPGLNGFVGEFLILSGSFRPLPGYTVLASVGLPGLNGFVGEFLILSGSFRPLPGYTVLATTGVILAAIYLLWMVQRVFFGPITHEENRTIGDIHWHELAAVAPLLVLMVWIGLYPNAFLDRMEPSVQQLLTVVNRGKAVEGSMIAQERGSEATRLSSRAGGGAGGEGPSAVPPGSTDVAATPEVPRFARDDSEAAKPLVPGGAR